MNQSTRDTGKTGPTAAEYQRQRSDESTNIMSNNNSDGGDRGEYEDEYGGQNGNGDEDCSGDDSVEYEDEHEHEGNEDDRGKYEDEHEGNGDEDGSGDDSGGEYGDLSGDGDGDGSEYSSSEESDENNSTEDEITIDGLTDILKIDMKNISIDDVSRYDFCDLEVAYQFNCWYSRMNGFSVRKSKVGRNSKGEKLQQTFVCSNEGYREDKGLNTKSRKREPRRETKCGCEAKFRVHINTLSGRCAADDSQIQSFRKVGIKTCQVFGSFANNSGGYHKIGFIKKDLYNQVGKQKRQQSSDASTALKFLKDVGSKDPLMFVKHTIDNEGRLQHLFWCDGESRLNYRVFGDVLAFDATYRKIKYMCPFVVFSGVNHHNQIVFATALVSKENEETYVWLLEQFMEAMEGKMPIYVITDGDLAMKNAIRRVFPRAHHRLCAWHLLCNTISNVGIPDVMPYLKKCMLGDIEVSRFEETWDEMVNKFGLEDNTWIRDLYEKRNMCATALICGNFFAGIRTTSWCEALHSHIGKFVQSRCNLTDFVEQFHRCLTYFRFREVESDFESNYGQFVLQTSLRSIERFASRHFTNKMFILFRPVLSKASLIRVLECHEMAMYSIYLVTKWKSSRIVWNVSYCPSPVDIRCSCQRMESIGLPCEHIIVVLVNLDFDELPGYLVLNRWSKTAKENISGSCTNASFYWDSHLIARLANLHYLFKELAVVAHRNDEDYKHIVNLMTVEINKLREKHGNAGSAENIETENIDETLKDPEIVRSKEYGQSTKGSSYKCGACGIVGHNIRSCQNITANTTMNEQSDSQMHQFGSSAAEFMLSSSHS
ncbi:protein FAR1-RELATED SEQUENCE 5-like [Trifolium pratense]|uniref:protein FAR1-RELATED SEQUENCE 5-like n=1 Tax=Trifolium pratense TaxID=57577 RepID=UPI001E694300|nr:protein FAR1-RELATED SEQUENCE 5-like [Trifolium pratense]